MRAIFFNNIGITLSDLSSSNPRQYWKLVKNLVKENSSSYETIPPLSKRPDYLAFTDTDKANT